MDEEAFQKKERKRQRGQPKMSAIAVNAELRTMYMTTLNFVGGVKYLTWLAQKHPAVFMQGLAKYMRADDKEGTEGVTFVVQQIVVSPQAVPGVLNSPVAEHVAPLKLVARGGEIIDVESRDG